MFECKQNIWSKLDEINISKIIILYNAKFKKKSNTISIQIESTFAIFKSEDRAVNWNDIITNDKPYLLDALKSEHADLNGKISGMLVYDNVKRKILLSGTHQKTIVEKFQKEL